MTRIPFFALSLPTYDRRSESPDCSGKKGKEDHRFKGDRFSDPYSYIFCEWLHYKSLINLFCGFSRISISKRKSVFGSLNVFEDVSLLISHEFSYPWKSLEVGFTYLGFFLKPNNYLVDDWNWLIWKFQFRINQWVPRCLSLGGHVTLETSVL